MSAQFAGPPPLPFDTADRPPNPKLDDPSSELAALAAPPRTITVTTRAASPMPMPCAARRANDFLRAYISSQIADWKTQRALSVKSWTRERFWQNADLLCDGFCEELAQTVAEECLMRRHRREQMAPDSALASPAPDLPAPNFAVWPRRSRHHARCVPYPPAVEGSDSMDDIARVAVRCWSNRRFHLRAELSDHLALTRDRARNRRTDRAGSVCRSAMNSATGGRKSERSSNNLGPDGGFISTRSRQRVNHPRTANDLVRRLTGTPSQSVAAVAAANADLFR